MKKVSSAFFNSRFASTVTFKGIHSLACLMLSKRDAPKGYVFVKANSEERLARKKAKRDIQRRKKAYDKARVKSFLTTERIKDLAAEGKQRRQQAIARRMLPSMEIPEDKPLDTEAQKEAQKEAQMESRRRMDERRQEMGLPSFAEEKEARKQKGANLSLLTILPVMSRLT